MAAGTIRAGLIVPGDIWNQTNKKARIKRAFLWNMARYAVMQYRELTRANWVTLFIQEGSPQNVNRVIRF